MAEERSFVTEHVAASNGWVDSYPSIGNTLYNPFLTIPNCRLENKKQCSVVEIYNTYCSELKFLNADSVAKYHKKLGVKGVSWHPNRAMHLLRGKI